MRKHKIMFWGPICSNFIKTTLLVLQCLLLLCSGNQCLCQPGTTIDTLFIQIETEGNEARFLIYGNESICCGPLDLDIKIDGFPTGSQLIEILAPDLSWSMDYSFIQDFADSTWLLHLSLENEDGLDFREKPIEATFDIGYNDGFFPGSLILNSGGSNVVIIENASFKTSPAIPVNLEPSGNGMMISFDAPVNATVTVTDIEGRVYERRSIFSQAEVRLNLFPSEIRYLVLTLESQTGIRRRWLLHNSR